MDIAEIKVLKNLLVQNFAKEIMEFEQTTECVITDIYVRRTEFSNMNYTENKSILEGIEINISIK